MSGKPFRPGDMRECRVCHLDKPLTEFVWRNMAKGYRTYRCRDCAREWARNNKAYFARQSREHRARVALVIDAAKAAPCKDCGKSYPPYVMDFDHVRGVKVRNVSQFRGTYSLEAIQAEIDKCDLVCSNCHRIRTFTKEKP